MHFAGHGRSDPIDPLQSALLLTDSPLTVKDLMDLKLHERPPLLAYLSACSTEARRNATLAIALAGTLALLIELRDTIRRIGPSPDRV